MSKYMPWQLIAPPATRFYQMADGNFSLYFEKSKVKDMVAWAKSQYEAFLRLEVFIGQQAEAEEEAELAKARKTEELQARAANLPNSGKGHIPNIRTAEAKVKVDASKKLPLKGMKPPKQSIAGDVVVTQDEVEKAVPELPKPVVADIDLVKDPGMQIALRQARALDARNKAERETIEEEEAPEEEIEEIPPLDTEVPPKSDEEIPETERPENIVAASGTDDDSPY